VAKIIKDINKHHSITKTYSNEIDENLYNITGINDVSYCYT